MAITKIGIDTAFRFPQCRGMATVDEIFDKLMDELDSKKLKGKDVARLLKTAPARISEMKRGGRRLNAKEADILAAFFSMDAPSNDDDLTSDVIEVPVLGRAPAGNWREALDEPIFTIKLARKPNVNMAFAVIVAGDSMDKTIADGCWAVIDPDQTTLYNGRVYLVVNTDGESTIKRYLDNPARLAPDSHNKDHKPIFLGEHPIRVIGRVVTYGGDRGL